MPAAIAAAAADDHNHDHGSATAFPASVFALNVFQTFFHACPDAASPYCSVLFLVFYLVAVHAGLSMPSGFHRG